MSALAGDCVGARRKSGARVKVRARIGAAGTGGRTSRESGTGAKGIARWIRRARRHTRTCRIARNRRHADQRRARRRPAAARRRRKGRLAIHIPRATGRTQPSDALGRTAGLIGLICRYRRHAAIDDVASDVTRPRDARWAVCAADRSVHRDARPGRTSVVSTVRRTEPPSGTTHRRVRGWTGRDVTGVVSLHRRVAAVVAVTGELASRLIVAGRCAIAGRRVVAGDRSLAGVTAIATRSAGTRHRSIARYSAIACRLITATRVGRVCRPRRLPRRYPETCGAPAACG